MINSPKLDIEYVSKDWKIVNETIDFYKQNIVDVLWRVIKSEILSKVSSKCFDILMEEISDKDKYIIDMNILMEILLYIKTHNVTNKFSVNLNPSTIINPSFLDDMLSIFAHYKEIDLTQLEFEITENGYFNEEEILVLNTNISKIQSLGIKIWIDDYPNLNNNNELLDKIENLDFVKIDKSFLLNYGKWLLDLEWLLHKVSKFIIDIRIRVGQNVVIVMEWVETQDLFDILRENFWSDISLFQWYYFHKNEHLE